MRRERETHMEHGGWFRRDSIAVDTPERRVPRGLYCSLLCKALGGPDGCRRDISSGTLYD